LYQKEAIRTRKVNETFRLIADLNSVSEDDITSKVAIKKPTFAKATPDYIKNQKMV